MIIELDKFNNEISDLPKLSEFRYENLFKVNKDDEYYFFNILRTVHFPTDLDSSYVYDIIVHGEKPYTTISYQEYGTQELWWLICLVNQIQNPVTVMKSGTKIKILKKEIVPVVLNQIFNKNRE